ncbi:MAG TPA: aminotransferase class III-fold pyridoxal phosphate-dependent enzyme [Dongiaceae bacterium]|nr:aminotransferase class III-fold pyridoxal phosphate-dependent enzyme [Dongiaceae bacterium]
MMNLTSDLASRDRALRERAARVIPGGMWGHMNAARLPPEYPQYFARGEGARLWDADGREYIDFICGWGPVILGYRDPEVEAAARVQAALGDSLNGPSERLVELAELMAGTIAHCDWSLFAKNGTDATTICVTVARAGTGRRKILLARRAYHGAAPWCTPQPAGTTAEDRAHQIFYEYNDVESLEQAAAEAGDDLAAVVASAFRHDIGRDHELPSAAFARAARALADRAGAALIVDDVRAGFRLHPGGSWELVGVRPDLAAWSKAIANGHALAAVTGNDRFRDAATRIFTTGSFWCQAVPMAAAIATITKLKAIDGVARMRRAGQRLRDGLQAQADAHGVRIRQSGPPQMPLILFEDDPEVAKGRLFCVEALKRGVYLHPVHTMFLSCAHGDAEIDRALEATDAALAAVGAKFG